MLTDTTKTPDHLEAATGTACHDVWVFAYGSLMWRPGFPYRECVHATLHGFRRGFCLYSVHYRGTVQRPGLVLGLERGGECEGLAYRVPASQAEQTLAYLRAREQVTGVYREKLVNVSLKGHPLESVLALTYVAEQRHPSFAGQLSLAQQARIIRGAMGSSGTNVDYLINTIQHLETLNIRDQRLERLLVLVGMFFANGSAVRGHRARSRALNGRHQSLRMLRVAVKSLEQRNRFAHRSVLAGI